MSGDKSAITKHLGKRDLLFYYRDLLLSRTGRLSEYKIDLLPKDRRMICVCYGNICRSPFAEGMLKQIGYDAVSVGLHTKGGKPAHDKAIAAAEKYGIDLTHHVSTSIHDLTIGENDLLLFMEYGHIRQFRRSASLNQSGAVPVLLGIHGDAISPLIFDPYGRSELAFQECFQLIVSSLCGLVGDTFPIDGFSSQYQQPG